MVLLLLLVAAAVVGCSAAAAAAALAEQLRVAGADLVCRGTLSTSTLGTSRMLRSPCMCLGEECC